MITIVQSIRILADSIANVIRVGGSLSAEITLAPTRLI